MKKRFKLGLKKVTLRSLDEESLLKMAGGTNGTNTGQTYCDTCGCGGSGYGWCPTMRCTGVYCEYTLFQRTCAANGNTCYGYNCGPTNTCGSCNTGCGATCGGATCVGCNSHYNTSCQATCSTCSGTCPPTCGC